LQKTRVTLVKKMNTDGSSLAERAYLVIRERILRGELPLGAVLSRRKLTSELEMSVLPISEALRRLEIDGLVESRPRVGTRIRVPSASEVRDFYVVREALECQSARLFSEKAKSAERVEVARMAEHMDVLFKRSGAGDSDPEFLFAVHKYHFQLHMRIAECAGSEALRAAIEKNQMLVFNWLFDVVAHRRALPLHFHRDLVAAISGPDPLAGEEAMRRHIRWGIDEVASALEAPPVAVEWRLPRSGSKSAPGAVNPALNEPVASGTIAP
jgi:DNA-binding GntR family transcriptional regulator